tara:strand:- start:5173 stop:5367 length:195 start_codon:yes stop_codon:yes gene_type:complete
MISNRLHVVGLFEDPIAEHKVPGSSHVLWYIYKYRGIMTDAYPPEAGPFSTEVKAEKALEKMQE